MKTAVRTLLTTVSVAAVALVVGVVVGRYSAPAPRTDTAPEDTRSALPPDSDPNAGLRPENPQIFRPESDFVPSLTPELLDQVTDSTPLPVIDPLAEPKDPKLKQKHAREEAEYRVFCEALVNAHRNSIDKFALSTRNDLTYPQLRQENQPLKYRGQVVHIEGRLKMVRRTDPPAMVRQAGVPDQFEGWVFAEQYGTNPHCIIFTELPEGIPVAEHMEYRVKFDGYLFKRYRYKAADSIRSGQYREVPLLIGHAPVVVDERAVVDAATSWWATFLTGFLIVVALLLLSILGLAWWLSRSDREVRSALARIQAKAFVEQTEQAGPPPSGHGYPPSPGDPTNN